MGAILIHKPRPMVHSWFVALDSHEYSCDPQNERDSYELLQVIKANVQSQQLLQKNKKKICTKSHPQKKNTTNRNIFACMVQGSFTFFISQLLSLCCWL